MPRPHTLLGVGGELRLVAAATHSFILCLLSVVCGLSFVVVLGLNDEQS